MYITGNPVPSTALEDMADNAQTLDALVTKTEGTTTDRLGVNRRVFQQILMDMGFQPLSGSFQTGATITARNQTLYDEVSKVFYAWGGVITEGGYVVPVGSTPATTGGTGVSAWSDKTDLMLRSELSSNGGASYVTDSVWTFPYVAAMKTSSPLAGRVLRTVAYHDGWGALLRPAGGATYIVVTRSEYNSITGNTSGQSALKNGGDGTNEWIDIELANGNVAVFQHEGKISVSQAGARGSTTDELNPVDDTLPLKAVYAWAGSTSSPLLHTYKSPMSGKTHHVHFEQGYYRADNVDHYGSVYTSGEMVGSYAGSLIMPFSNGASFFKLRHDDDGTSNAPVFDGIRFRSKSVYVAGTYVIDQPAGEFPNGANSVYFYRCWFQSAGGGDAVVKQRKGGDWRYSECTFDASAGNEKWVEFGDETSTTELTIHNELYNCTFYKPVTVGFSMLNAQGLVINGGTLYGAGMDTFISDRANYQNISDVTIGNFECKGVKTLAKIGRNGWNINNIRDGDVQSSTYGLIYLDKAGTLSDINIVAVNARTSFNMPLIKSNAGCVLSNTNITGNSLATTYASPTVAAIDVSASTSVLNNFGGNVSAGFVRTVNAYRPAVNGVNLYQLSSAVTPGSIAANTTYTLSVSVIGAYAGDAVTLSYPSTTFPITAGIYPTAYVNANDTVTLVYRNQTASPITVSAHDVNISIKAR